MGYQSDLPNRLSVTRAFCLVTFALCLFVGCGRKTTLRPPELVAPETIATLSAEPTTEGVALRWERPENYADGSRMPDLGAFRIERSADAAPFAALAEIAVSDRERFRKLRHFQYVDATAAPGRRYRYRVFSITLDGDVSQASNVADVVTAASEHSPTDE